MKILLVLPDNSLGGAEQYLKMIVEHYSKTNAQIKLVFLNDKFQNSWVQLKDYNNLEYQLYNSNKGAINALKFVKDVVFSSENEFDYIFTSHVKITGLLGLLVKLGLLKKKYFIARESTSVFKRFSGSKLKTYKFLYKYGYSKVNLLICQTDHMKDQLIEACPKLKNVTKVIPNPIDLEKIFVMEQEKIEELEKGLLGNYIVSAGRLIPEKGFDILIESFALLIENINEDLNLVILGEGVEREKLELKIKKLGLEGRVFLKGLVLNVFPYFKNAKGCVVSSRIEGFPNVLLQMMSQNTNIVSTDCAGGIVEIPQIKVCKIEDVDNLRDGIYEILNKDCSMNRPVFDNFLKKRSIENFVSKIKANLV